MGRGGMLSEEAHGWERGGDHLGSAASHVCTDTEASTPHHLIVASSFFIEQKQTKQSIKKFLVTCESIFIDTVNLVVVQLKDAKVGKTRDAVRRDTGDLIVR